MAHKWIHPALVVIAASILAIAQSEHVPVFHPGPPPKGAKLSPIVPKAQRTGEAYSAKYQQVGYDIAQKIPKVLYQLPCYCYCERIGHKSLRTCFESDHAAHCSTCLQEAYYAYFQTRQGKSVKQIRQGIEHGEYKTINLDEAADAAAKM